jgi:uncharacterized membrane protein YidH (DUF202 family)
MKKAPRKRKSRESKQMLIQEEQVLLSKERTILSFMRTALTFIGVGVVIVNLLKEPLYQAVGYIILIIGFVEIIESLRRLRSKQKVMEKLQKKTKV